MSLPTTDRIHSSYAPFPGSAPTDGAPWQEWNVSAWRLIGPGVVALLVAGVLGVAISAIHAEFGSRPERAVMLVAVLCAALVPIPVIAAWVARPREANPARLGVILLATIVVVVTGIDLYVIGTHVTFPADILIWAETEFVSDIIKLRTGYPLYTPQVNNESFIYTPGSQVLTWLLAAAMGQGGSIVAFRAIQLFYVALAAVVALLCARRILILSGHAAPAGWAWGAVWLLSCFLFASNGITNPFVQFLHNDALALLIAVVAFWLLLEYAASRSVRVLALMAVLPAAAFMVKQSLAIWAVLYCVYLFVFDRSLSRSRLALFALASFGGVAATVGACYLAWGPDFFYWTFTVLGAHPHSVLRSIQHLLDSWVYFAVGIVAGLVLLRRHSFRLLIGPWLVWLAFLAIEGYTSGVAWMLNHLGPGSLIAGAWLLAAATALWRDQLEAPAHPQPPSVRWLAPAMAVAVGALLLSGMGAVRIPSATYGADAYRYVADIERELTAQPVEDVLLDSGSWMYLRSGVVQKDRVTSFGDRGWGAVGDFSGMIRRLEEKRYRKILVRNLHSPDFWYDHYLWDQSSGVRAALLANYREVGRIEAVGGSDPTKSPQYLLGEISILTPNAP
ncbi:MAG: hypothetical protein M3373_06965 [Gemmatimonadota bacterium]|nr:hypothetical protein [Gemmatimonadota bacterium]